MRQALAAVALVVHALLVPRDVVHRRRGSQDVQAFQSPVHVAALHPGPQPAELPLRRAFVDAGRAAVLAQSLEQVEQVDDLLGLRIQQFRLVPDPGRAALSMAALWNISEGASLLSMSRLNVPLLST